MLLNTYLVFALGKRKSFQAKLFHILGQEKSIFYPSFYGKIFRTLHLRSKLETSIKIQRFDKNDD